MAHERHLVQRRLPVEEHVVAVEDVPFHHVAHLQRDVLRVGVPFFVLSSSSTITVPAAPSQYQQQQQPQQQQHHHHRDG